MLNYIFLIYRLPNLSIASTPIGIPAFPEWICPVASPLYLAIEMLFEQDTGVRKLPGPRYYIHWSQGGVAEIWHCVGSGRRVRRALDVGAVS